MPDNDTTTDWKDLKQLGIKEFKLNEELKFGNLTLKKGDTFTGKRIKQYIKCFLSNGWWQIDSDQAEEI
jgi:hypothetical protein